MALRTLDELNSEFAANHQAHDREPERDPIIPLVIEVEPPKPVQHPVRHKDKKKPKMFALVSDVLFYAAILLILITVATSGTNSGKPKSIFGFSYFTVISGSMADEIPKGSFILVKQVDPQELKIGDNVTYMYGTDKTITHKIMTVYENYQNTGSRGFETKGTNNTRPDEEIVHEDDVVGKVIFTLPAAGAVMSSLGENVHIVFILFALCIVFSFSIRGLFVRQAKNEEGGKHNV